MITTYMGTFYLDFFTKSFQMTLIYQQWTALVNSSISPHPSHFHHKANLVNGIRGHVPLNKIQNHKSIFFKIYSISQKNLCYYIYIYMYKKYTNVFFSNYIWYIFCGTMLATILRVINVLNNNRLVTLCIHKIFTVKFIRKNLKWMNCCNNPYIILTWIRN